MAKIQKDLIGKYIPNYKVLGKFFNILQNIHIYINIIKNFLAKKLYQTVIFLNFLVKSLVDFIY